jgi:magnesium transporter
MADLEEIRPWERLRELALVGDSASLARALEELDESDQIVALGRLTPEERGAALAALEPARAAELLEKLPDAHAAEAVGEIEPLAAAEIIGELWSDDRADLFAQLEAEEVDAILREAPRETAEEVRKLLQYAPESAGGLMITEYVAVNEDASVAEVVAELRQNAERYAGYVAQYVYAIAKNGVLRGVLPLRELLLAPSERKVRELMIPNPTALLVSAGMDRVFELFDRYNYLGIPVTRADGVLVGIVLREDVDDARVDRAESDQMKSLGIIGGEELRSMPFRQRSMRRLSWLSLSLALQMISASAVALFQDTLAAAIALAYFLPIVSGMSGNAGTQAIAVSLRELSLGLVRPLDLAYVLAKEASVGVLSAALCGGALGLVGLYWKGNAVLGLVVGGALALNTVLAVTLGGALPLVLRRMGVDPALASGPVLTTITDLCGFFFVLSFATLALSQLQV